MEKTLCLKASPSLFSFKEVKENGQTARPLISRGGYTPLLPGTRNPAFVFLSRELRCGASLMWDALWSIAFGKLGLDTETCSYSPQVNVGCVPKKVRLFCHGLRQHGLCLEWCLPNPREVLAKGVGRNQSLGAC